MFHWRKTLRGKRRKPTFHKRDCRMEEIVLCSICLQQFDSLHFIPKMLECGHTFCSPCMTKLFQKDHTCPNCRAQTKGNESSLPTNYSILKVVDIYKSKSCSDCEIITSIENMKKKCVERKEILSKSKSSITSSLEVLDECLEKLEELTESERRVDAVNVKKILNEVEEDFRKTMVDMFYDDIKSAISILLSDFEDAKGYLEEIYKRIYNEEKIFAVRIVEDKIKYGKVSKYENKLFFHSLSLSEVPTDSSLIWFDDLKQCATDANFYTFLEICCNSKRLTRLAIIKMFDKQRSHHFIKMCTGEYGPSFKEASFEKGDDNDNSKSILFIQNFVENSRKCSRTIDYDFNNENKGFYKCASDQMFLYMKYANKNFSIILPKSTFNAGPGIIGKVISPTDLKDCINYDFSLFLKILDCGIILEV